MELHPRAIAADRSGGSEQTPREKPPQPRTGETGVRPRCRRAGGRHWSSSAEPDGNQVGDPVKSRPEHALISSSMDCLGRCWKLCGRHSPVASRRSGNAMVVSNISTTSSLRWRNRATARAYPESRGRARTARRFLCRGDILPPMTPHHMRENSQRKADADADAQHGVNAPGCLSKSVVRLPAMEPANGTARPAGRRCVWALPSGRICSPPSARTARGRAPEQSAHRQNIDTANRGAGPGGAHRKKTRPRDDAEVGGGHQRDHGQPPAASGHQHDHGAGQPARRANRLGEIRADKSFRKRALRMGLRM